jgi:hypothetical protein
MVLCATAARGQDHPGGMLGFETPWWPEIRRECPLAFQGKTRDKWTHLETCIVYVLADDPIHPVLETIAPMSGLGGGLSGGWDLSHGRIQGDIAGHALVSVNRSWLLSAEYSIAPRLQSYPARTPDRPRFDAYATLDELPQLAFYTVGRASRLYGQRELVSGADYTTPVTEWLRVGGRFEFRRASISGLDGTTSFVHYDAIVLLHYPMSPPHDVDAELNYHIFQDVEGHRLSFGRFNASGTWTRPLKRNVRSDTAHGPSIVDRVFCHEAKIRACDYGTLTVRGRLAVSSTFGRSTVPFYYQPTLGGADINNYDTLRGFADYRFRGADDWLTQIEYGRTIWGPIGLLFFYDAGRVGLSFSRVHQDFGLGASVTVASRVVLRTYLAFGGGEGVGSAVRLTGVPVPR